MDYKQLIIKTLPNSQDVRECRQCLYKLPESLFYVQYKKGIRCASMYCKFCETKKYNDTKQAGKIIYHKYLNSIALKECGKCHIIKNVDQFYVNSSASLGKCFCCATCMNAIQKAKRDKLPKKEKEIKFTYKDQKFTDRKQLCIYLSKQTGIDWRTIEYRLRAGHTIEESILSKREFQPKSRKPQKGGVIKITNTKTNEISYFVNKYAAQQLLPFSQIVKALEGDGYTTVGSTTRCQDICFIELIKDMKLIKNIPLIVRETDMIKNDQKCSIDILIKTFSFKGNRLIINGLNDEQTQEIKQLIDGFRKLD